MCCSQELCEIVHIEHVGHHLFSGAILVGMAFHQSHCEPPVFKIIRLVQLDSLEDEPPHSSFGVKSCLVSSILSDGRIKTPAGVSRFTTWGIALDLLRHSGLDVPQGWVVGDDELGDATVDNV